MKYNKRIFIMIFVMFLIISVYYIGGTFAATAGEPGSDQDPLVTKGYVDVNIDKHEKMLQQIQTQIDTLQNEKNLANEKITLQDQQIKALQTEVSALKVKVSTSSTPTTPTTPTTPATGTTKTGQGTINANSLNMRSASNTTAAIVGKLTKGMVVDIVSKSGEWYRVKNSKGVIGWTLGKYVTIKK